MNTYPQKINTRSQKMYTWYSWGVYMSVLKMVKNGQKPSRSDEKLDSVENHQTSTNLELLLKNLMSTIGSLGLNIGRSESDEDSIFVSGAFRV